MRKNIRRSLMVAAAATGVWALSTAGASAAELPVPSDAGGTAQGAVEQLEKAGEAGETGDAGDTLADTVRGATDTAKRTTGTVEDAARGVTGKLPSRGIPENGLPTNTLPTSGLPTSGLPTGAIGGADDVEGSAGELFDRTGHASKAVKETQKDVRSAVSGLPSAPAVPAAPAVPTVPAAPAVPAVPGAVAGRLPAHTLPAPAVPALPDVPKPPVPAEPSAPVTGDHAQEAVGAVRKTVSTAHPVLDGAAGAVLPPAARGVAVHVRPIAYQVAVDAAVTADGAVATTAPYAHELGTNVHGNGHELVSHAVTNVRILVTVPSKRDLTDPAHVPGLAVADRVPAGL